MAVDILKGFAWGVDEHTVALNSGTGQPQVSSAVSTASDRIRVTFDRDMDEESIGKFWRFTVYKVVGGARLHVVGAIAVSATEVDLITEFQETVNYEVRVNGAVRDGFGNLIDTANNTAQFLGTSPDSDYLDASSLTLRGWYGLQAGMQGEEQTGFIQDIVAPILSNQNPLPSSTGALKTVDIALDLTDAPPPTIPAGVDLSSVLIYVEGNLAYRGDTDSFVAPYVGVNSQRTVISGGHRFVIDKTADYLSYQLVTVRVVAQDLASPTPNVLDTTYDFRVEDFSAPSMDTEFPTGTGISETTLVSFSCKDEAGGSGIDSSSINVTVDEGSGPVNAVVGGVFQSGWDGVSSSITANAFNGYDVVIDKTTDYASFEVVTVSADCNDNGGNPAPNLNWNFTTVDHLGVHVIPIGPTNGQTGVDSSVNIVVKLEDEDSIVANDILIEVDIGSGFVVAFDYDTVPQFKSGWNGPGSSVVLAAGVYTITIDPETDLPFGTTIQVRVTADDPSGNGERL